MVTTFVSANQQEHERNLLVQGDEVQTPELLDNSSAASAEEVMVKAKMSEMAMLMIGAMATPKTKIEMGRSHSR